MTNVTFYLKDDNITGFNCTGHSGYAEAGTDIVCAAVSMLVINTINSIETLTDAKYSVNQDEEKGIIDFSLEDVSDEKVQVLLRSMQLGLKSVGVTYGSEYVTVKEKDK